MPDVEEDSSLRAPNYERPLTFTYDRELDAGGGFRFTYDNGEINCSDVSPYANACRLAPEDLNTIARERFSFVYLDVGRWGGTEYNFGLVSGRDCYLCEFVPNGGSVPSTRNASVTMLFGELRGMGHGVRVVHYAEAPDVSDRTTRDNHLYLLLPDAHLPPITWAYRQEEVSVLAPSLYRDPPSWFQSTGPCLRNPNLYRGYYGLERQDHRAGRRRTHESDIFGGAGAALATFLNSLATLGSTCRSRVHLITMGDTYELWLNREYQFRPGGSGTPSFVSGGVDRVADWVAEVQLWNMDVADAFRATESAGLAEVKHIWGNHEAYLMSASVTSQTGLTPRSPEYNGLNGDLHAEHGHRFDSFNFDNTSRWRGPLLANLAFWAPSVRQVEPIARDAVTFITASLDERDIYIQGASLLFLSIRLDDGRKPFSVFCMGHTHRRFMRTFRIRIRYSLHGVARAD